MFLCNLRDYFREGENHFRKISTKTDGYFFLKYVNKTFGGDSQRCNLSYAIFDSI